MQRKVKNINIPGRHPYRNIIVGCVILFTFCFGYKSVAQNNPVLLKNGFFYINNKKFFIKGIGYEVGAIPGQLPWERTFDAELLSFDMHRIQSAGFNTIRTWGAFTEEELALIAQFDLKIIMGIWIDPAGDFNDPIFISSAIEKVNHVLSYSKNYPNIIAYLIMNEPLPETIFSAGYTQSIQLWTQLIQIIHEEHPGIPVSIANTCNGTYINPEVFDFSAYNVYPYNPATVNFSHKFTAYVEYLSHLSNDSMPLIITEYGLSVSPSGPGNWGYGGNTTQEQSDGIRFMYRSLIDGGAAGSCVFNYSDGWYKSGNEFSHDDHPEEWFGLIAYQNVADKFGIPRPVWENIKSYQHAIIVSPKNSAIYLNKIPLELFCNDTTKKVEIFKNAELLYTSNISGNYLIDTLSIQVSGKEDQVWDFNFYDQNNTILKEEQIIFLSSDTAVNIPVIDVTTNPETLEEPGIVEVTYNISAYQDFAHSSNINYVFYPHVGWNYGSSFSKAYPQSSTNFEFSNYHIVGDEDLIVTFAAGFDLYFNNFSKRIYNQLTLAVGNVLGAVNENQATGQPEFSLYPNPADDYFSIIFHKQLEDPANYQIFDLHGTQLISGCVVSGSQIDISFLKSGCYLIEICTMHGGYQGFCKLIKNRK